MEFIRSGKTKNNHIEEAFETEYAPLDDYEIDIASVSVMIIVSGEYGKERLIPVKSLPWRELENGSNVLTLTEIAEQVGPSETIYVWQELALRGEIFIYNYNGEKKWHEHGTTKGYA